MVDRRAVRLQPADDAYDEQRDSCEQHDLAEHVKAVPYGAVRHLASVGISQCLGQRAARTEPTAIGAFSKEINHQRNEDECLQGADYKPPAEWMMGENVIYIERPSEDETVRPPVFPSETVIHLGKQRVGDTW